MVDAFDLLVIGAGPGGLATARRSAAHGARVAVIEADRPGGTCVNRGCIPEALTDFAAGFPALFADAPGYGWHLGSAHFAWNDFLAARRREIERLDTRHAQHLKQSGVTLVQGRAAFAGPHTLAVGERRLAGEFVAIATGAVAGTLPVPGGALALADFDLYRLVQLPERLALVGDGYIATRAAGTLRGLGIETVLVCPGDGLLPGYDGELVAALTASLAARGVEIVCCAPVAGIAPDPAGIRIDCGRAAVTAGAAVVCGHWRANTAGLGLERVGVATDASGAIVVDAARRTSLPHVWALGDCTDRARHLTPVAVAEGRALADHLFGGEDWQFDDSAIPVAISAQPEAATVGLSEEAARAHFGAEVHCHTENFLTTYDYLAGRNQRSFVKLVTDGAAGRVLGVHMLGHNAVEIVQGLSLAVRLGATKADLDRAIGIHPSSTEEFFSLG